MTKHWAYIDDLNHWFNTCLPGGSIPDKILTDVQVGSFSGVPHGQPVKRKVNYYPELVCDKPLANSKR